MKDKWININFENDELKPYEEPDQNFNDNHRIGINLTFFFLSQTKQKTKKDEIHTVLYI